ncbi:MAG: hypothetical protein JRE61_03750 [Deltaproteobacteria bacterium]|nr:hypothetical protein [Deltaproteobacteria bacterium]
MENKKKALEILLRKNIELYEQSRIRKEKLKARSGKGNVIRRRKGDPDKRIVFKLNRS